MDSTDQPQPEQPGETATVSSSHAIDVTVPQKEPDVAVVSQGAVELASKPSTSVRRKSSRQRIRVLNAKPVYLCGVCQGQCKEANECAELTDSSIGCDTCRAWYHWGCVVNEADFWSCPGCQALLSDVAPLT